MLGAVVTLYMSLVSQSNLLVECFPFRQVPQLHAAGLALSHILQELLRMQTVRL